MAIRITPKELPAELRARVRGGPVLVRKATYLAAVRGQAYMKSVTKVDRGQLKNAWKAKRVDNGAVLENSAPYAGVIELGARPHPVGVYVWSLIREWVRRNITYQVKAKSGKNKGKLVTKRHSKDDEMLDEITWGIVGKIRREGQEPTYFVRNSMPKLQSFFGEIVEDLINKQSKKRAERRAKRMGS